MSSSLNDSAAMEQVAAARHPALHAPLEPLECVGGGDLVYDQPGAR